LPTHDSLYPLPVKIQHNLLIAPKDPRIHSLEMTNLFDIIVKNINQIEPNFISSKSMKNIACFGQKINKIEKQEVPI